ncbi:MAG: magnesium transporter CorA family protein [Elusimicrobiaceae bacterium]|uniref:Magnesium transporter CorA family protein n=1 Tax=Candidatus Avelusimicrobium gallicola TaxID=2562704 RepID=A0A928DQ56_9BACT|nr:magnesium transporter CorA family protein [Elusimicrobium sp.]MBQ9971812.1 magnesium transporter CorA family protein [Elusimicrobiaceae bacterium]
MKQYIISDKKLLETDQTAQVYVYTNPTVEEQRLLVERYQIDEHTLASALDPDELPRLEFEPEHIAMIYKRPKNYSGKDQLEFKVASVGMFLFEDKLIVVLAEDIPLFVGKRFHTVSSIKEVFLKLVYNSISHYVEHLRIIHMISEEIEDKITESMDNTYLLNLFSLVKSLVYYAEAITSNGFVFEKTRNLSGRIGFNERDEEMLDDIIVENRQCKAQADIYSNILAQLLDARSSIVNNNLNQLIKKLNVITIWMMVPTFVVSAYGMNVALPLSQHPNAFWMLMGICLLLVWLVIMFWRHKNW